MVNTNAVLFTVHERVNTLKNHETLLILINYNRLWWVDIFSFLDPDDSSLDLSVDLANHAHIYMICPAHPGFWSLRKWFFPFQLDSSPGGWLVAAWFEQDAGAAVGLEVWFVPTYSLVLVLEPLNLDRTVSSRPTKKGWDNRQLWTSSQNLSSILLVVGINYPVPGRIPNW